MRGRRRGTANSSRSLPRRDTATQVQAEAGKTYWIAIGSRGIGSDSTEPYYRPFFLAVGVSPPPPQ
jgi:hypothetical protein